MQNRENQQETAYHIRYSALSFRKKQQEENGKKRKKVREAVIENHEFLIELD